MTTPAQAAITHPGHEQPISEVTPSRAGDRKKPPASKKGPLTDLKIRTAQPREVQYKLSDFGSLYLLVKPNGSKLWQWAYKIGGKAKVYSIGRYPEVSLQDARMARDEARKLQKQGIDPTAHRSEKKREAEARVNQHTLQEAYEIWYQADQKRLADSSLKQRKSEISRNVPKALLNRPIASITRPELVSLLDQIALRAPSVAQNVRQHLNGIFELAINRGNLNSSPVPPPSIVSMPQTVSHAALMGNKLGDFLYALRTTRRAEPKTKVAMLLLLYGVVRKNEAARARWAEFDLEAGEWLLPARRMKERFDHFIPLSRQAVELLKEWRLQNPDRSDYVFPNRRDPKRPMAGNTLNGLMVKTGFGGEGTPHGMRSAFSTHFNKAMPQYAEIIELALSHMPANKVRAAYNKYKYREERGELLQAWADLLDKLMHDAALRAEAALTATTH